jgi:hypothetical protein
MNDGSRASERRRTKRIPAQDLPDPLKRMYVRLGGGERLQARTIDASTNGICLILPLPVYSIHDFEITLKPQDGSFTISDELVYIKPVNNRASRVSIQFSPTNDLSQYNALLAKKSN